MPDDLRTRIAKALYRCDYDLRDWEKATDDGKQPYYDDADAVIEALSDVLKTSNSHACGVHCPYGLKDERCHHWTTDD
jgi:hypothetical protein